MYIIDPIEVANPGVLVSSNVPENDYPTQSSTRVYAAGERVIDPVAHLVYESKTGVVSGPLTITPPGTINWLANGLAAGTSISFMSTGILPTGLIANTIYYVVDPALNTIGVSATLGGMALTLGGSPTGVLTASAGPNVNKPLSDTTYWLLKGSTNRWRMFDSYNNTQTVNPETIEVVIRPQAVSQGVYLGNLSAASITITVTDPAAGIVYDQTFDLQTLNTNSSFYRWLFARRRLKTDNTVLDLPAYYNASIKITIRAPGGIAKCGMCRVGPAEQIGETERGLSRDFKDWSTTRFNFDGTSETTERGYSKRMAFDLIIGADEIDYAHERMEELRQKTVVFIGSTNYGMTTVCGKASSLKSVIAFHTYSRMSLQIEGVV